jgi:hypothetical protein
MESRPPENRGLRWHKLYVRRRLNAYLTEEQKLDFDANSKDDLITAFIHRGNLDPPSTFWYTPLRNFLNLGDFGVLDVSTSRNRFPQDVILLR